MITYTFFWLTGQVELLKGNTPKEALALAGYEKDATKALDFIAIGDIKDHYKWDDEHKTWNNIKPLIPNRFYDIINI